MPAITYEYSVKVTAEPATEPVTLTELANHVRNEVGNLEAESGNIDLNLKAARTNIERLTGRALITRTQRLSIEDWLPYEIAVPDPPLIAVSSFAYTDTNGDAQTLTENTDFIVNTEQEPGIIKAHRDVSWPSLQTGIYRAAQITYTCGYGAASDVPAELRQAILLMAGHWYKFREPIVTGTIATKIEMTVKHLIGSFKVQPFGRRIDSEVA